MDTTSSEVSAKIKAAIKAKLEELGAYVDDELPDYVMVMIANKKTKEQMSEDLSLFLGKNANVFTKWLHEVLHRLSSLSNKPGSSSSSSKSKKEKTSKKSNKKADSQAEPKKKKTKHEAPSGAASSVAPKASIGGRTVAPPLGKSPAHKTDSAVEETELGTKEHKHRHHHHESGNEKGGASETARTNEHRDDATTGQSEPKEADPDVVDIHAEIGDEFFETELQQKDGRAENRENRKRENTSDWGERPSRKRIQPPSPSTRSGSRGSNVNRVRPMRRRTPSPDERTSSSRSRPTVLSSVTRSVVSQVLQRESEEYDPFHPSMGSVASVVKVTQRHYSVPEELRPKGGVFMRAVQDAQKFGTDKTVSRGRDDRRERRDEKRSDRMSSRRSPSNDYAVYSDEERRERTKPRSSTKEFKKTRERTRSRSPVIVRRTTGMEKSIAQRLGEVTVSGLAHSDGPAWTLGTPMSDRRRVELVEDVEVKEEEEEEGDDEDLVQDNKEHSVEPAEDVELFVDTTGKEVEEDTRFMVTLEGVSEQFRNRVEESPVREPIEDPNTSQDSISTQHSTLTTVSAMSDSDQSMKDLGKLRSNVVVVHPRITAPVFEPALALRPVATTRFGGDVKLLHDDEIESLSGGDNLVSGSVPSGGATTLEKCRFWPSCRNGESCPFVHPTTKCRVFPACKFGDKCLYIHPACKFDAACTKKGRGCPFAHTETHGQTQAVHTVAGQSASVHYNPHQGMSQSYRAPMPYSGVPVHPAPYQPNQMPPRLPFLPTLQPPHIRPRLLQPRHGVTHGSHGGPRPQAGVPCKFGGNCKNQGCPFKHPTPCKFGTSCSRPNCPFFHNVGAVVPSVQAPAPRQSVDKSKYKWTPPSANALQIPAAPVQQKVQNVASLASGVPAPIIMGVPAPIVSPSG